ncbi:MAG: 1-acyl-sn-glycerol-3-phosphate acyltransferase [Erythrobacter sp.]
MPDSPERKPTLLSRIVRRAIIGIYHAKGWKVATGGLPDIPKYLIVGSPHSSNWDFVFFVGATARRGVKPGFMGKHTLFEGVMGNFMYDMGGVPVDRSKRANYVEQVAAEFSRRDRLALVMAPEGSRNSDGEWRSGFWHIARAAQVPIVATWVDPGAHRLGFSEPFMPGDSYGRDLAHIAEFLRKHRPEYSRYKVLEAQAQAVIAAEQEA